EIVSTPGTGGSSRDAPTNKGDALLNSDVTSEIQRQFQGKIKVWETPYPATVGAIAGMSMGDEEIGPSYERSKQEGVSRNIDHINQVASQCPETKFALVGYSQGADVVGDTAALIANGRSTQVGPE